MKSRKEYLEKQAAKYSARIILYFIMRLAEIIGVIFLFGSFFIHWFSNDSMTFIQVLKWSIVKYWWLYFYYIFMQFFNIKMKDDVAVYKDFKQQLDDEIIKEKETN